MARGRIALYDRLHKALTPPWRRQLRSHLTTTAGDEVADHVLSFLVPKAAYLGFTDDAELLLWSGAGVDPSEFEKVLDKKTAQMLSQAVPGSPQVFLLAPEVYAKAAESATVAGVESFVQPAEPPKRNACPIKDAPSRYDV